ncbi:MAG: head decoration protein [Alphaproteobacteria bacterium]
MSTLTEGTHAGEAIVSEGNGSQSRDVVTVLSGQNLKAGHVIGRVTVGAATPAAVAGNTGNGVLGAVTLGAGAKAGVYRVVIIEPASNAGRFTVEDPDGVLVDTGTVAVEFAAGGLTFTLADGGTDFAAGDRFTITVALAAGKAKEWNPANVDGSQIAIGVMHDAVDASSADKKGVAYLRLAEVSTGDLVWFSGADANAKAAGIAQLRAVGIIAR